MFDINNKITIITDGTSVIGKTTARALAEKGAVVTIADYNQKEEGGGGGGGGRTVAEMMA